MLCSAQNTTIYSRFLELCLNTISIRHVRLPWNSAHRIKMSLSLQIVVLLLLALPIACISWTVTHEEFFREPREFCQNQTSHSRSLLRRKFFYVLTCEYCFSHYVAIFFLLITRFRLLYPDWRGYVVALFSLVWIANQFMSIYSRLRLDIKHEHIEIKEKEHHVDKLKAA